ncbi:hypothetical protein BDZ94DRAFT_1265344, partial [Collybia nuda]
MNGDAQGPSILPEQIPHKYGVRLNFWYILKSLTPPTSAMLRNNLLAVLLVLVRIADMGLAAPNPQETETVLHCGLEGLECPKNGGWTCCGPLLPDIGGICRQLEPGWMCA